MRILFIHKHHFERDGTTTYYFGVAKALQGAGHEVAFFSTVSDKNLPTPWSKYFTSYTDLQCSYSPFKSLAYAIKIIYNFEARRKLRALLRDFKPDIAHLHNIYYHLTPSIIDELAAHNIPIVQTLQDYTMISPNYSLFAHGKIWDPQRNQDISQSSTISSIARIILDMIYPTIRDRTVKNSYAKSILAAVEFFINHSRKSYDKIQCFFVPTEFFKKKHEEYGFQGHMEVLGNPLDVTAIQRDTKTYEPKDYLLYYGRLSEEKGVPVLLDALTKTKEKLKIVGQGPQRSTLEQLTAQLGVTDRVEFLGFKKGDELAQLVGEAKVIVVPSIWYEPFGYTVLESLARGKIVIASRIGGIPELIEDGVTGFLFEPGNSSELARVINTLSDYDLQAMGKNALAAAKMHDISFFYSKLMDTYEQTIEMHSQRR